VVFLGNDEWSVPPLEALAGSGHGVILVMTRTPRPGRRGRGPVPTPVAAAGRRLGLPVEETPTVKSGTGFDRLAEARPDVLAVVAYGEILPASVLSIPSVGPVNLHFSLLPELRGAAPVQRALLAGMRVTGVSTILMDEGMDTGPILLQAEEAVDDQDDAGSLGARLAALGGRLLVDSLDRLAEGTITPRPQDHARATEAPKLRPTDRVLDFTEDAESLARRVRALAPEPGAATTFRQDVLKVFEARAIPHRSGEPGTVLEVGMNGFLVGTGSGALAPVEVAPQGRRRMTSGDFVRGYRPKEGERLGDG
jgi:methionyl-tRNA formyltransferase